MIVLKIIGVILLVIVLLVLALLMAVLFVPIRYQVSGTKHGEYRITFRVSWFLRLLHMKGQFDEQGLQYRLKALMFTLSESDDEGTA